MKLIQFFFVTLIVSACATELHDSTFLNQEGNDGISIFASVSDFVDSYGNSKSTVTITGSFAWEAGDRIGLFSNKNGAATQTPSQLALTLSAGTGTSAAYSSATGWSLVPGNNYNYFSYFPYSETNTREEIEINYIGQEQTTNNSTSGLGSYDYLYSSMTEAATPSSASISFHHIGCLTNINISVPPEYGNTTFYNLRLYAKSELFTSYAKYSVDDVVSSGSPSLDAQTCDGIKLSFGDVGIKPTDGVINAWIMTPPVQWKGQIITAKLYADKGKVPALTGSFIPDANQVAGTQYAYFVTANTTKQTLPDKPAAGEQLHILLFGHSFAEDCTEYIPAINIATGITDVHLGRMVQANCSLAGHWGYITFKGSYKFCDSNPITGTWSDSNRKTDDVLAQYPWDYIFFQQSIGFDGEGDYSSYQPYLNYLTEYVTNFIETVHVKTPIVGWNMFWGYNEGFYTDYDRGERGALKMYEAIVQATKDMTADTTKVKKIHLVVPSGTAIQNARITSLNDSGSAVKPSTTKLLLRDGFHLSYGIGRYTAACTWFQMMIAPIYGVDITGNTYRPTSYSFEKDKVTDERAAICWKCAIEAVNHPYEVTPIVEN